MLKDLIIFAKAYELLAWLHQLVAKYPKAERFVLAARTENAALDLLSAIIEANHAGGDKAAALGSVELALERQRIWLRLAFDLRYISLKQYEQGARRTDEIGRLLGGWRKRFVPRGGSVPAASS